MNIKESSTALSQDDEFLRTRDTRFASALLTLGFDLWAKTPYTLYQDLKTGQQQILWQFNTISKCGRYYSYKMLKAYKNPNLMNETDDHSVALSKCIATLKNRELLIDICNNAEPILQSWQDDGNLWYVPANSELGQEMLAENE